MSVDTDQIVNGVLDDDGGRTGAEALVNTSQEYRLGLIAASNPDMEGSIKRNFDIADKPAFAEAQMRYDSGQKQIKKLPKEQAEAVENEIFKGMFMSPNVQSRELAFADGLDVAGVSDSLRREVLVNSPQDVYDKNYKQADDLDKKLENGIAEQRKIDFDKKGYSLAGMYGSAYDVAVPEKGTAMEMAIDHENEFPSEMDDIFTSLDNQGMDNDEENVEEELNNRKEIGLEVAIDNAGVNAKILEEGRNDTLSEDLERTSDALEEFKKSRSGDGNRFKELQDDFLEAQKDLEESNEDLPKLNDLCQGEDNSVTICNDDGHEINRGLYCMNNRGLIEIDGEKEWRQNQEIKDSLDTPEDVIKQSYDGGKMVLDAMDVQEAARSLDRTESEANHEFEKAVIDPNSMTRTAEAVVDDLIERQYEDDLRNLDIDPDDSFQMHDDLGKDLELDGDPQELMTKKGYNKAVDYAKQQIGQDLVDYQKKNLPDDELQEQMDEVLRNSGNKIAVKTQEFKNSYPSISIENSNGDVLANLKGNTAGKDLIKSEKTLSKLGNLDISFNYPPQEDGSQEQHPIWQGEVKKDTLKDNLEPWHKDELSKIPFDEHQDNVEAIKQIESENKDISIDNLNNVNETINEINKKHSKGDNHGPDKPPLGPKR